MRFRLRARRRPAVSELVATLLTVAMTIVVGMGVFSYVNTQARVSESQYGQSVGQSVQYLEENFLVATVNYNYPGGCTSSCKSTSVTIYFYNAGKINNQFQQIEIFNSTRNKIDITFTGSTVTDLNNKGGCTVGATTSLESPLLGTGSSSFTVNMGSISAVTLTLPNCYTSRGAGYQLIQGYTYSIKALGAYGNMANYYQAM
jgi:flagellin-like protein